MYGNTQSHNVYDGINLGCGWGLGQTEGSQLTRKSHLSFFQNIWSSLSFLAFLPSFSIFLKFVKKMTNPSKETVCVMLLVPLLQNSPDTFAVIIQEWSQWKAVRLLEFWFVTLATNQQIFCRCSPLRLAVLGPIKSETNDFKGTMSAKCSKIAYLGSSQSHYSILILLFVLFFSLT